MGVTPLAERQFVGNKAKGSISKRVFQENKARQIFRKTNISYSLIRTPKLLKGGCWERGA